MTDIAPKRPRLRLDRDAYEQLCRQVLKRDAWRCQSCGAIENLQVHHKQYRSRSGDDSEENLITLCNGCHELTHRYNTTTSMT
jgi:5-methylcytosine-specific restriction endonuclease McrA